jgi:cell division protein FtsB
MQVQTAAARPPYVQFEKRPIEDREATQLHGRYIAKDQDWVLITPAGSRDCVEREVQEWFAQCQRNVDNGQIPKEWLDFWKSSYQSWKSGEDMPVNGTPIKSWPLVSPADVVNLLSAKVMTVEDLAAANEEVIKRLGMGGRALKIAAENYLKASAGPGALASQLTAVQLQNDALQKNLDALAEQNRLLKEQVAALSPQPLISREEKRDALAEAGLA